MKKFWCPGCREGKLRIRRQKMRRVHDVTVVRKIHECVRCKARFWVKRIWPDFPPFVETIPYRIRRKR